MFSRASIDQRRVCEPMMHFMNSIYLARGDPPFRWKRVYDENDDLRTQFISGDSSYNVSGLNHP